LRALDGPASIDQFHAGDSSDRDASHPELHALRAAGALAIVIAAASPFHISFLDATFRRAISVLA